ncbi:peptide chain release factor N(5)-glutamine methyltransferase [Fluviicola sp.]|jgi:release factor glutamine methyltransferase|uniref:peptide chain release factor N(5)-glutamine methyltransferase n=1 Tax=Fluviicola sp. TaxID=1917219 RepID=UPI0028349230|nr:peptide chain release factor N(5)-glutamine methyltransferase [Fluviicola sp.]MDR0801224.1 peptide chain release factor N(5)-glutamine methyltransferase [Fluviicola sp.]
MDQKQMLEEWKEQLGELFSEREIRNLFYLTLEDVLGFNRSVNLFSRIRAFSKDQTHKLQEVLSRLKMGEPLQYIAGFTCFDDLKIKVAPEVLIPRPETEELVAWVQESIAIKENLKIEDWCTGSGCIALALKNRNPGFEVKGYDISPEALEIAAENARELNLEVEFQQKDALNAEKNGKVDVVISNPPYIPWKEKGEMHQNVTEFEPGLALFVPNEDPLVFYRSLADYASKTLLLGGFLFFELHENYALEIKKMIENRGFVSVEIRMDLQGKQRMLKAIWSA